MLENLLSIHLKLLQRINSKNNKAIGDLIGNKIANRITRIGSQTVQKLVQVKQKI